MQPPQMWSDGDVAALVYAKLIRPYEPTAESLPAYHPDEIERRWRETYPSVLAGVQHQTMAMAAGNNATSRAITTDDVICNVSGTVGAQGQCEWPSRLIMTPPCAADHQYEEDCGHLPATKD